MKEEIVWFELWELAPWDYWGTQQTATPIRLKYW